MDDEDLILCNTNSINMKKLLELDIEPLGINNNLIFIDINKTPIHNTENIENDKIFIPESPKLINERKEIDIYSKSPILKKIPTIKVNPVGSTNNVTGEIEKCSKINNENIDRRIFLIEKFNYLKEHFPDWDINIPNDSYDIVHMENLYDVYLKKITISLQCGEWKTFLACFLLFFEIVVLRWLKLDIQGFALAEIKKTAKYNRILYKYGEERYSKDSEEASAVWQLVQAVGLNAMVYIFLKYIKPFLGGDLTAQVFENLINTFIENDGTNKLDKFSLNYNEEKKSEEKEKPKEIPKEEPNILSSLLGAFSGGNESGDYSKIIGNIGNMATKLMNPEKKNTVEKINKKIVKW